MDWTTIGDVRIEGIYTGFSPDQSAGITVGAKLPTGNYNHNDAFGDIDRDSEIGTGSTDILLGGFYRNNLTPDGQLDWFAQLNFDLPVLIQDQYRPGDEVDGAGRVLQRIIPRSRGHHANRPDTRLGAGRG